LSSRDRKDLRPLSRRKAVTVCWSRRNRLCDLHAGSKRNRQQLESGRRRLKGYRESEIIGEHFSRFYTEEDRATGLPLETARREAIAEMAFSKRSSKVGCIRGLFFGFAVPIRETRVAKSGADGQDTPAPYVLHEGDFRKPLNGAVSLILRAIPGRLTISRSQASSM
jgi:hypothetical protein